MRNIPESIAIEVLLLSYLNLWKRMLSIRSEEDVGEESKIVEILDKAISDIKNLQK